MRVTAHGNVYLMDGGVEARRSQDRAVLATHDGEARVGVGARLGLKLRLFQGPRAEDAGELHLDLDGPGQVQVVREAVLVVRDRAKEGHH